MDDQWSIEVSGHKITLDAFMQFSVTGPLFDDPKAFSSYRDATDAIDKRQKQQASQEREKLSIPVVDESGIPRTITGVHAGHYGVLGVGDARALYPPEDWIVDAIKEQNTAQRRDQAISRLLQSYRIDPKPYGLSIRSHEEAVARIKDEAARMAALAAKGKPQETSK